ncbi:MAG: hypothetical protein A2288_02500 [Candidatus Moranbacteria bacterium RIFOXYA12_FULL_44_15]|nr:MAG: hypothetical protein A2288_02500 [Candidatus Moranbacteria bacterium RIFOXYA12_FULL_44_15]
MKEITFSLREFCEIKALKTIMEYFSVTGHMIYWKLLNLSVNTDFNFCSIEQAFWNHGNVSILQVDDPQELSNMKIYGFKTDMTHQLDVHIHAFISCAEIAACRLYKRSKAKPCIELPRIVLGNVKVKSPVEESQTEIFERLAQLPYQVIIVPRHPLTEEDEKLVKMPGDIQFRNTMGELEYLQASANLTIMGRIFSADGLKPDDDHNPLEATINSNTICGIIKEIPDAYKWLYEESELVHQCRSYDEVFSKIDDLLFDSNLPRKLEARDKWILGNRQEYFKKLERILEL